MSGPSDPTRERAIYVSILTMAIPFSLAAFIAMLVEPRIFIGNLFQTAVGLGVIFGIIIFQGTGIGWFVHWYFANTSVGVVRMAIALSILSDVAVYGWLLMLVRTQF